MKKLIPLLPLLLLTTDLSAEPSKAPKTMVMMEAAVHLQGSSGNFRQVFGQLRNKYYVSGACPIGTDFAKCDTLQFGLSVYPGESCDDSLVTYVEPAEDGAEAVYNVLNFGGSTSPEFCDGSPASSFNHYRPADAGLRINHDQTFPGGAGATDPVQDLWWERPYLTMLVVADLPQQDEDSPSGRVKKTLEQTCLNFQGGPTKTLPSMPTWVMMFRKAGEGPVPYGQLLAAAGGSGVCCYDDDGDGCDPVLDAIDVCDHIDDESNSDIVTDLADGKYNCGRGDEPHQVGVLAFPSTGPFGTLPDIKCHLDVAEHSSCDSEDADLFPMFSCIRQLPRGVSAADVIVRDCPAVGPCTVIQESYGTCTEANTSSCNPGAICKEGACSDFTYIDEKRTMFILHDRTNCAAGGSIEVLTCPREGEFCNVPGAMGRCAVGQIACPDGPEVCLPLYEAMPEICNGLDDDCNGVVDNMSNSWENFSYTLPDEYTGLDCRQTDVCGCPDGLSPDDVDTYGGNNFTSYLQTWTGTCLCGEGVEAPGNSPAVDPVDPQASCANAATTPSAVVLILLGFFGLGMRRFARSRG